MALVDVMAWYFALRVAGLEPADWNVLPAVPLAVFFVVLNGGYVVLLTAALGQTMGKMAMRVAVVAEQPGPVGVRRAAWRTLAAVVSLAPMGLGFVWSLFGDHRAWHDHLAHTRVIVVA
jgi:uncharacterized RDD family membrane protein YckC